MAVLQYSTTATCPSRPRSSSRCITIQHSKAKLNISDSTSVSTCSAVSGQPHPLICHYHCPGRRTLSRPRRDRIRRASFEKVADLEVYPLGMKMESPIAFTISPLFFRNLHPLRAMMQTTKSVGLGDAEGCDRDEIGAPGVCVLCGHWITWIAPSCIHILHSSMRGC